MIKAVIFDWGNTLMRDFGTAGPMKDWDRVEVIPGVAAVLEWVSERYRCVVATGAGNSNTADMTEALRRGGLNTFFNDFFSASDLGCDKSDPLYYQMVINNLQLLPGECVMVGDSYQRDIIPAGRLGIRTILFNEYRVGCSFPEADAVIFEMNNLPEVLLSLETGLKNIIQG